MSVPSTALSQAPASYSQIALKGHDLQEGMLTCNDGQWSNLTEIMRQPTQAKLLNNFQMLTRGVWSNPTGIGWSLQRAGAFNSGASFMDFGVYEDFLGNQTMLFQVGSQVYSYNIGTSTETAYNAPLTGLSTSSANLPCMRPFIDSTGVLPPMTVYVNGNIQPVAITGTGASNVAPLGFVANGSSTPSSPGGQFGASYTVQGVTPGTIVAQYNTAATTPQGICLGSDGNMWFCDTGGAMWSVTPTGVATSHSTVAVMGAGSAPQQCVSGPDGKIYFTDHGVSKIGAIDPTSFTITASAAAGGAPTGICTDGVNLYFVMSNLTTWKQITSVTAGFTISSIGTASTNNWSAVCIGPDGSLWAVGPNTGAVGVMATMTLGGTFTSYTSTLRANTLGGGITPGPDGRLWSTDEGGGNIIATTTAGVHTYYPINPPLTVINNLLLPVAITVGGDGNLWFSVAVNNNFSGYFGRITTTGALTLFTGLTAISTCLGIAADSSGNLWITEISFPNSFAGIANIAISTANPQGITTGPDGALWFCNYATNSIGRITPTGQQTEYPLPNANSGPLAICSDGTNLWFTEYFGNRIGRITTAGVITEFTSGLSAACLPVGIVHNPGDGNMYFAESATSKIGQITPGGVITEKTTTTGASMPWGIATDGTFLYICESAVSQINQCTTWVGAGAATQHEIATITGAAKPLWIAYGSDTRVWFTENIANRIGAMTTGSSWSTPPTKSEYLIPAAGSQPQGIAAASDKNLYFTEAAGNRIGRITTAGVITEFAIPSTNPEPVGIVDGPDQSIWFTEYGAGALGNFLYGGSGTWPGTFQLTKKTYSKPLFTCYFNNRQVYFGFDQTTNAALDVLISNQGTVANFTVAPTLLPTDAVSFTIPGLGLPTGCDAFRLTNQGNQEVLVLGFQRGIVVIMGNGVSSDATTYEATILTREFGLVSNRTFIQVQNDLFFLSTNGIRSFANLSINANLLNSAWTYQMQDYLQTMTTAAIGGSNILVNTQAFSVHHKATLEVQTWFPATIDSSQNKHAVIMNYNFTPVAAQMVQPVFSSKSNTSVACGIEFQGVMYGGGYDGHLQKHYSGNTYNGAGIPGTIDLCLIATPGQQENLELRQGIVITDSANAQNFNVTTTFFTEAANTKVLIPQVSPEGIQVLSASAPTSEQVNQFYFEAGGEGKYVDFQLTTTGTSQCLDFAGLAYVATKGGLR